MKRIYLFFLAITFSQHASAVKAYFDYKVFQVPGSGPYVEFVLSILGTSVSYNNLSDTTHQASVEATLIIMLDGKVIDFRKPIVDGPVSPFNQMNDFMMLERFPLPAGNYDLEITLRDINDPLSVPEKLVQKIWIDYSPDGVGISDIQFISAYSPTREKNAFSKSGYDIMPYISNYFPTAFDALVFYSEAYNTDKVFGEGNPFVFYAAVTDNTGQVVLDIARMKRQKAAPICPEITALDISSLQSGEYFLLVQIRNKNNETVSDKRLRFVRNLVLDTGPPLYDSLFLAQTFAGKFANRDSLFQVIQSLLPISGTVERISIDNQLLIGDLRQLQSFLYQFWLERDPINPEAAWQKYEQQVKDVHRAFGLKTKPGWRTDRGRVYLQYGPPNTRIERHNESDYYPYEIWHYYKTNNNLTNKKFLFINPSLSGDFELIHTNVPNEVQNADWYNLVRSNFRSSPAEVGRNRFNQADTNSGDELEMLWHNPH